MPRYYRSFTRNVIVPIGPSIAYVPLTQGKFALVSSDDSERVSQHNWHAEWRVTPKDYGAARRIQKFTGERGKQTLHQFLLGNLEGFTVDHVLPGNALNCLPHNLRHATNAQQTANQRLRSSNKSGYKGVRRSRAKRSVRWIAQICIEGRLRWLGSFDTAEDAYAAYCSAARESFGECARL